MAVKTEKTYTLLSESEKPVIEKCSALLPNHMQCYKAGEFQITLTKTTTEMGKSPVKVLTSYQLCRAHAFLEQQQDNKTQHEQAEKEKK